MKRSTPFTGGLGCPAWLTSCSLTWPLHLFGQIASNISFNGKIVGNWKCLTESIFSSTWNIFVNICEHSIHCTICTLDSFSPLDQARLDILYNVTTVIYFPQIFPNYSPNSNGVLPLFSCPEQLNRWPCHSLTQSLTKDFTNWHTKNNLIDFRHFRHLIRVMRGHDLTKKYLHTLPTHLPTYLPTYLPMYLH